MLEHIAKADAEDDAAAARQLEEYKASREPKRVVIDDRNGSGATTRRFTR